MRRACLLLATWLGAGLVALSAREGQSAQPLLVQLPPGTASELTRIVYWTTGPNGGVGAQMDGRRGTDVYPLPTVGASHVKAVIYVPGFELATLDLPIPVPAETAVAINLRRLAAIPFSARIVEPATRTFANLLVRGGFTAVWICSFFNQPACLPPTPP